MTSNISFKTKIIFKLLEKAQFGRIRIILNEQTYEFGSGDLVSMIKVESEKTFFEILSRGDIGLAEAIIKNEVRISDEAALIHWACLNEDVLKDLFHGGFWGTLFSRLGHWLRPNSIDGAKKNIMAHYDLGNEFYKQWLDPSMSYSSAIFSTEKMKDQSVKEDLTEAQNRKYDRIIKQLNIKSTDRVLEVGCGWGGFFSRAIETTGCHVTAVMNSPAQHEYNQALIKSKNLENNIDLQLKDYRLIEGKFDKIVSIEMIEAVGEKYWPVYFSKIKNSLKPEGRGLIQAITIKDDKFEDYKSKPDFIKKYVFPGGMLLSNDSFKRQTDLVDLKSESPFEFGQSYALTLKQWKEKFQDSVQSGKITNFDDSFYRLWNFYLSYCEGAFKANRINVAHFEISN